MKHKNSSFEKALQIGIEDVEFSFNGIGFISWLSFLLNPRRLRGSDFIMRWSQGVWSEKRIIEAMNKSDLYFCLAYGTSSTAPKDSVRDFELYFELLDAAGHGNVKRPDLLIFKTKDKDAIIEIIAQLEKEFVIPFDVDGSEESTEYLSGEELFPFVPEDNQLIKELLSHAIIAIECENSLWKATQMPNYGETLRPQRRLGGKSALPKSTIVPTIIVKDEDKDKLFAWQNNNDIDIHIWHVFFDRSYGISLSDAFSLVDQGLIDPTINTYQAPGGATTKKSIYKFYYHYAYNVGTSSTEPDVEAKYIIDKNGHILPYVTFNGGELEIHQDTFDVLGGYENR